jgi:hypothetical protein
LSSFENEEQSECDGCGLLLHEYWDFCPKCGWSRQEEENSKYVPDMVPDADEENDNEELPSEIACESSEAPYERDSWDAVDPATSADDFDDSESITVQPNPEDAWSIQVEAFASTSEEKQLLQSGGCLQFTLWDGDGRQLFVNSTGQIGVVDADLCEPKLDEDGNLLFRSPYPDERDADNPAEYTEQLLRLMGLEPRVGDVEMLTDWNAKKCREICNFLEAVLAKKMDWNNYSRKMIEFTGSKHAPDGGKWSKQRILKYFEAFAFEREGNKVNCNNPLLEAGYQSIDDYIADSQHWVLDEDIQPLEVLICADTTSEHVATIHRRITMSDFIMKLEQFGKLLWRKGLAGTASPLQYLSIHPEDVVDEERFLDAVRKTWDT